MTNSRTYRKRPAMCMGGAQVVAAWGGLAAK